jgi:hypothetical protein
MVQQHIMRTEEVPPQLSGSATTGNPMPSTARSRTLQHAHDGWYGQSSAVVVPSHNPLHGTKSAASIGDLMEPTDFDTTNFDEEDAFVSALLIPDGGAAETF